MCKTDPENIIGKIEMLIENLELYAEEDKTLKEGHPFTDRLNGYYHGRSEAFTLCAKWLKAYLEGRA